MDTLIQAMREPTDDMAKAGGRVLGNTMNLDNQDARAKEVWAAMVANYVSGTMPPEPKLKPHPEIVKLRAIVEWCRRRLAPTYHQYVDGMLRGELPVESK